MTSVADSAASTRGIVLVHAATATERTRCQDADVESCTAQELAARVRDARKDGRPFVAILGDDRDLHVAAAELAHSETALVPLRSLDTALPTADHKVVDIGRVNGHCFLHHTRVGSLPQTLRELSGGPRLVVRIDGRPTRAWSVFIGNGCFGPGIDERSVRESTDDHVLDVRIVRGDGRGARLRRLVSLLLHRGPTTRDLERRTCTTITVDVPGRPHVEVALDGERTVFATPLRCECDANALRVLAPEG